MATKIGVIGAGQMGAGIAQVAAMCGCEVKLYDTHPESLAKGMKFIESILQKGVEKEKITPDQKQKTLSNLTPVSDLTTFSDSELCIEAIIENFEIKKTLFEKLDGILPSKGILCSNTSSISITKLAATTKRPSQFIGMHFMNPVPKMKLVEIMKGCQTSKETLEKTQDLVTKMGKVFTCSEDIPGFIANRILMPYINEAIFVLYEVLN